MAKDKNTDKELEYQSRRQQQKMGIYDSDNPGANRVNLRREENPSDKYGSIREFGTENRIKQSKKDALKSLAFGVATAPSLTALDAMSRDIPNPSGPIGSGADYLRTRPAAAAKAIKDTSNFIGNAASKYKASKEEEKDLDRELADQMKRETRGMKKGGKVSASSRGDGIAQRGKTKGRMV
jgi:hypothetical protein